MKRCPECRKDYCDDTLQYCLEDGVALVQGAVPSADEPATAILHDTAGQGEAKTSVQVHTTDQSGVFPPAGGELSFRWNDRNRKKAAGHQVAAVYSGLGEKDKAFEWLEKDFQSRDSRLNTFRWETQFEPLRQDPRFEDLVKRMGLSE